MRGMSAILPPSPNAPSSHKHLTASWWVAIPHRECARDRPFPARLHRRADSPSDPRDDALLLDRGWPSRSLTLPAHSGAWGEGDEDPLRSGDEWSGPSDAPSAEDRRWREEGSVRSDSDLEEQLQDTRIPFALDALLLEEDLLLLPQWACVQVLLTLFFVADVIAVLVVLHGQGG